MPVRGTTGLEGRRGDEGDSAGRRAAEAFAEGPARLAVGITHHLVGPDLPRLLRRFGEREGGVTLHLRTGATRAIAARALVNAAGPWAGDVLALCRDAGARPRTRLVQGSHIVVPKLFDHAASYIFQAADGRIVFTAFSSAGSRLRWLDPRASDVLHDVPTGPGSAAHPAPLR